MSKRLNFEIDDETARKARMVKAVEDLTWSEFVEEGSECLAERYDVDID